MMLLLKGKSYFKIIVLNLIFIVIASLLAALLFVNSSKNKRLEVEERVINHIVLLEKNEGRDIIDELKNSKNEDEYKELVNETISGLHETRIPNNNFFSLSFIFIFMNVLFIFALLHFVNFILIKNAQRKYIKEVDKYIDSLRDKSFDVRLDESDESIISKLNNRFNKLGLSIKSNYSDLESDKVKLKDSMADISHQIKTPLAALSMYNEILLESENLENRQIEFLTVSQNQISRLKWLISSMLKLSRLEANSISFKKENFKIGELSKGFEELLFENLKNKNLKIIEKGDLDKYVFLDLSWTREALLNIVKNATEHCYEKSEVIIDYKVNELMISIDIINKGEKISLEDISKIFKRFYKAKKSNMDSVGIGLNLSKQIIEAQSGVISVENILDGVKFNISFLF